MMREARLEFKTREVEVGVEITVDIVLLRTRIMIARIRIRTAAGGREKVIMPVAGGPACDSCHWKS
jgi:hypothetical protein